MARDNLVLAPNCKLCKVFGVRCEGMRSIKGSDLFKCPSFIKLKASQIIKEDLYIPYPVKVKRSKV